MKKIASRRWQENVVAVKDFQELESPAVVTHIIADVCASTKSLLVPNNVVALRDPETGKYCADEGYRIICNRNWVRGWEMFRVVNAGNGRIALKGGRYGRFCADEGSRIRCNRNWVRGWEKFVPYDIGGGKAALRGGRGRKFCARNSKKEVMCNGKHAVAVSSHFLVERVRR